MSTPARIRRALDALEARRIAIERQIIADMERKFFSTPAEEIIAVSSTPIIPVPGLNIAAHDGQTSNGSYYEMTWLD